MHFVLTVRCYLHHTDVSILIYCRPNGAGNQLCNLVTLIARETCVEIEVTLLIGVGDNQKRQTETKLSVTALSTGTLVYDYVVSSAIRQVEVVSIQPPAASTWEFQPLMYPTNLDINTNGVMYLTCCEASFFP